MKKIFIGGSRNINCLNEKLRKCLLDITNNNYLVLIGDADGADKAVQQFLSEIKYKDVKIYCSGENCRNNLGNWSIENVKVPANLKGIKYYMEKDKKMAKKAESGFMLWDGKSAGTLNNILELLKENKKTLVYYSPDNQFFTITGIEDVNNLVNKCDKFFIDRIKKKISMNKAILEIRSKQQLQLSF